MIEIHHSWGHPGIDKTLELMTQNYWRPGMKKDIQKYIASCNTCQMVKPDRQAKGAPLHLNEVPEGPWQIISRDMMGPLLESKGFDTILVVVDRFTKKSFFLPTNSTVTSKGIGRSIETGFFQNMGCRGKSLVTEDPNSSASS